MQHGVFGGFLFTKTKHQSERDEILMRLTKHQGLLGLWQAADSYNVDIT